MRTKIWKCIYAVKPNSDEVIDEFSSVSDLHSSMSIRGVKNYDVLHYCEMLVDDEAIAVGEGSTEQEAREQLERNLIEEYHVNSFMIRQNPDII